MDKFYRKENHKGYTDSKSNLILEHDTLLLILDMQEKLIANITGSQRLIFNIKKLIDTCNLLNVHIAITEQNPLKLGKTLESIIDSKEYTIFEKMEFSCSQNTNFID